MNILKMRMTTTATAARPTRLRRARASSIPLLALLSLIATGCFTLNVNVALPEAAVQRATDDYVRELYKAKEKGKATESTPSPSPSVSMLRFVPLESTAFAADEMKMKLDSSKARRIFARLRTRVGDIIAAKKLGHLGENNQGLLVIHAGEKLKPTERSRLQSLVSDENSDRQDLYEEAVKSNHLDRSKISEVEKSFTRSFQTASPSGTWIQGMDGQWIQKP